MSKSIYIPFDLSRLLIKDSTNLTIPSDYLNRSDITSLSIPIHWDLKRIVIGTDCFGSVRLFELDGLSGLESVKVKRQSFKSNDGERNDGVCRIVNCPKFKSLEIGDGSFCDYHSFELNNLPSLQFIDIGQNCFDCAPSFSLTGLNN